MNPPPDPILREEFTTEDLFEVWPALSREERLLGFNLLPRPEAEEFFLDLDSPDQAGLLLDLPAPERRSWMRLLAPDDAADLVQEAGPDHRQSLLDLLDEPTCKEVRALLAYAEDQAGGLMNPRFARARPDMTVDEAIAYLRRQTSSQVETLYYIYVLDEQQRLLGIASVRQLFAAPPDKKVRDVMETDMVTVPEDLDQEAVSRLFAKHDFMALPVVNGGGRMKGIVTVDDIVDVVNEEATEDIQKFGGMEALDSPYFNIRFGSMVKKRAGWLTVLFLGEMLTASAMTFFEAEIARAVVLALFVPLIISSGGNCGSQASTLVIRAMALGEVKLGDWWRVVRRELVTGLALGSLLGAIGFLRIVVWQSVKPIYGEHYMLVAVTVATSLVGVVTFGTFTGSLLPFALRRLGLDPASASAPFVATLVDVTGLVIYFTIAAAVLTGTLL
jgi:magnesium transporter